MKSGSKAAAVFAIVSGMSMIGWWTMALSTDQMPEIHTMPIAAVLHLTAEFLTGALLIVGGYGMLANRWWGLKIHLVSLGLLLYAVVQASGYYAQQGAVPMIGMFAAFAILTVASITLALNNKAVRV
jgi:hypothetical protein